MRAWDNVRALGASLRGAVTVTVSAVAGNWSIAIVSIAIAFGIWVVVTDVENPRAQSAFPPLDEGGVRVTFVNVPTGLAVEQQAPAVRVTVEAREDDLSSLTAADFEVRVDMSGAAPGGVISRNVEVSTGREGVRVVSVEPRTVSVTVAEVTSRPDVEVEISQAAPLPDGYRVANAQIDPQFVTVTGLPGAVDQVHHVEARVTLSGVRQPTFEADAQLVPVTENRIEVARVTLSQTTAHITFTIEEQALERTLVIDAPTTGTPALGYRIIGIEVTPDKVTATGATSILDGLPNPITVDRAVDISGATTDVTAQRGLPLLPEVALSVTEVTVRVLIEPIVCAAGNGGSPCDALTFAVSPRLVNIPTGLVPAIGPVRAFVRLEGPLEQLGAITAANIEAVVSLAAATAGTARYPASVTITGEGLNDVRVLGTVEVEVTLERVQEP